MDVTGGIFAITIVVQDLALARSFYERAFGLPVEWGDENSAIFRFGSTMINLLRLDAAPPLIEPAAVSDDREGARAVYTVQIADVDAAAAELAERGVALLNGPVDRPWGPRTLSFRDPDGTIWELATP
jgi:lactoylglutathione lyase